MDALARRGCHARIRVRLSTGLPGSSGRRTSGRFAAALLPRLFGRTPDQTTRAPPVGFELETIGFQFYAIANLDKTTGIWNIMCILFISAKLQARGYLRRRTVRAPAPPELVRRASPSPGPFTLESIVTARGGLGLY